MTERLIAKLDRLGAEAGIKEMTPEIYQFAQLLNDEKMKQWDEWKAKREWVGLTDEEILSDDTLRYYYGMNGGAGPVSQKGKKVIAAIEQRLKDKNT